MLIILAAHVPRNPWTLWIPARFGFSDATEIFVFCSGMASALAFGALFVSRGWAMGAARIAFRAWQVYWAHVGVFVVSAALLVLIDAHGWGLPDRDYVDEPSVRPFLERTAEALPGLLTLTYVPGLFDILPMYLVVLALIPVVMALRRAGGGPAVAAFVATLWALANLADWARGAQAGDGGLRGALMALGERVAFLNLPAEPWGAGVWFFNPFGWQAIFFLGFAFGSGWLSRPAVTPGRLRLAAAVLVVSLPFAWHQLHLPGFYLPDDWLLQDLFEGGRALTAPLHAKTPLGLFRILHFLALAYIAVWLVGPGGALLREGFAPPRRAPEAWRRLAIRSAAVAAATAPYAWGDELAAAAPGLAALVPGRTWPPTGVFDIVHVAALVACAWSLAPERLRERVCRELLPLLAPVLRRVGQQSLAVFMTSIPLSILLGLLADRLGRGPLAHAFVNLAGFAVLIGVAYLCAWFKSHPWRNPAPGGGELPAARATVE